MRQDLLRGTGVPDGRPHPFVTLAISPGATWDPSIPIAAARAGAIGVLDLTFLDDVECALEGVDRLAHFARSRYGVLLHGRDGQVERAVLDRLGSCDVILLTPESQDSLRRVLPRCREVARQVGLIVTSADDLAAGADLPLDFLISKGCEAGGCVGPETALALLEQLRSVQTLPVYVWGGVGPASAGAYLVAGAHGLVLDWQLSLTRESPLPRALRRRIEVEGIATDVVALGGGAFYRCSARTADRLRERLASGGLAQADTREKRTAALQKALAGWSTGEKRYPWPIAEDAALAVAWRAKATTVARTLAWTRELCEEASTGAAVQHFLVSGGGVAPAFGVTFPVLVSPPGPVTDWAGFADSVSEHGAVPLVPLVEPPTDAMRGALESISQRMGARPWCVDLTSLTTALESSRWLPIVDSVRPPLALVPETSIDDLAAWEHNGTRAFLVVGSDQALAHALRNGVRRLVFPTTPVGVDGAAPSLGLWDDLVRSLEISGLAAQQLAHVQVLLDGGRADASRAAALQVVAEPLVEMGVHVGLVARAPKTSPVAFCDAAGKHLLGLRETSVVVIEQAPPVPPPLDVAIVGMSCFLPGANELATYWKNILESVDAIREIPGDRFDASRWFDANKAARDKIYSRWGGFIGDIPFDPLKYGIPPAAIRSVEPIQLLTLELVDQALRDAGYGDGYTPPKARTAVILGASGGMGALGLHYAVRALLPEFLEKAPEELLRQLPEWTEDSFPGILLNVITGRITNRFDFGGVNFTVDAACASSLAAVYLACQELTNGTADLAIAGGCDTVNEAFAYTCFSKTTALSPTGRSRAFDASADGIAISEGLASVVLKRRVDAERDGDRIYAVIRGAQGASDGRHKGLTAPRLEGQMVTLERSYAQARISPASLGLVEAHGTGTAVGDPTECQALGSMLARAGARAQSVGIGSVKSMIGHTKSAAGVAGLIKAALALHHRVLPPTLHVENPSPKAGLLDGPLYANGTLRPWVRGSEPRRAGVSAFGFGGTNFHVVLEEYEGDALARDDRAPMRELPSELVVVSGGTREELRARLQAILNELIEASSGSIPPALADVAFTLHNRALAGAEGPRAGFVATSLAELRTQIDVLVSRLASPNGHADKLPAGVFFTDEPLAKLGKIAFLFPGQGSQYPDMLRDLAIHFPEVARRFEVADRTLHGVLGRPLSAFVFPPPAYSDDARSRAVDELKATNVAQPALGASDVAVLRLLERFGVRPEMVGGHSYGELVALHAAGCLSEEDLYRLSHARGQAIVDIATQGQGEAAVDLGQMLAVRGDETVVRKLVAGCTDVWVANLNSRKQIVVSGTRAGLVEAAAAFQGAGLMSTPIAVACAFHSPIMRGACERFERVLADVPLTEPGIPVYSNWTGRPYPGEPERTREHLAEQLVSEVRFADEIEAMYGAGARVFVEVGPNRVLSKLVDEVLEGRAHVAVVTHERGGHGANQFLAALARLYVEGVPVDLERLWTGRKLVDLDEERDGIAASAAKPLGRHIWLINAGYARPAHEPPRTFTIPKLTLSVRDEVRTHAPAVAASTPVPPVAASVAPSRAVRPEPTPPPPAISSSREESAGAGARSIAMTRPPALPNETDGVDLAMAGPRGDGASETDLDPIREFQETMRQFLETQQSVMHAFFGAGEVVSAPAAQPRPAVAAQRPEVPPPAARAPQPAVRVDPVPVSPQEPRVPVAPLPRPAPPARDALGAQAELVRIVTDRTGYPAEMLDLDAGLEADLGIDSIKRVEIIAAFRRAVAPEIVEPPAWFMEQMSQASTLRAILEGVAKFVRAQRAAAASAAPPARAAVPSTQVAAPAPTAPKVAALDRGELLRSIVTERTGYPPEMLELDAGLESDLGIDSIKRVEIIAAFRRAVAPDLAEPPAWFMEQMSAAATLQAMLDGVEKLVGAAPASASGAARAELLRSIVAERTGYPTDMLELDAGLESDLGIDSIKRVEIIAAFRRAVAPAMAEPPAWFMEQMSAASTLQAILDGMEKLVTAPAAAISPAPVRSAPTPAAETPASADAAEQLRAIVAERTGYPPEMLELDAGLESDLGIDSIKRVEIVAAFRRAAVPEVSDPPSWFMEQMSAAATLRAILEGIAKLRAGRPSPVATPSPAASAPPSNELAPESQSDETIYVPRSVARAVPAPLEGSPSRELSRAAWVLTDDGRGLSRSLSTLLRTRGVPVVVLESADLASREATEGALARVRASLGAIGAIVHLRPLREAPAFPGITQEQWSRQIDEELKPMLFLLQAFAPELKSSTGPAPIVVAVSEGGGDFDPTSANEATRPWRGGLAGLLKSAAQEWPRGRFRNLDVQGPIDGSALLREVAAEGPIEVGYRDGTRLILRAVREDLPNGYQRRPYFEVGPSTVVLATGGARGITAQIVHEIASRSNATVVLVGRSPLPAGDDDPETIGIEDRGELRRRLLARMKAGGSVSMTPKAVEERITGILHTREMLRNVAQIRAAASHVEYVACDVRDAVQLARVVNDVTARLGGIDVVLHGAGVIEDKYIVDKTADSFERVLGTKLDPMLTLAQLLDPQRVKLVMLFSSVAGFFGNVGQADYATANEVLNRMARRLRSVWPGKVVAMNWGPWLGAGSMVTADVARELESKSFGLLTVPAGRRAAWLEFLHPTSGDVRVVVGSGHWLDEESPGSDPDAARRAAASARD